MHYKRTHPTNTNIELAVKTFALSPSAKYHSKQATSILGIFRANFAPLNVRINTHWAPVEENCTRGIFLEIYKHLTPEQQDMIQWGLYVPERAKAAYLVPFQDIDTTRTDFAIVRIAGQTPNASGIRSKMRVDHICLPPVAFAKRVIANAKAAGNSTPFPTHEWLWSQITTLAKTEFGVRLVSNYTRKILVAAAEDSLLEPSHAALVMGDKTKLQDEGIHLDNIYNPNLRPMERENFINHYAQSGITARLTLPRD